ncbi:type II pantothenate kinase [Oceanobacillus senegalensis]|uniref:type II pantothenate kinase n=1 Tax=Oceanobacillus senegalensis TaxID=1936063 RepID=UPI000A3127AD|nr:type II pantothenate kinase [Oceanobacillus senegalensis]
MTEKIGIDAGGSLIKMAYEERGDFHVKSYDYQDLNNLFNWLQMLKPDANLFITGGKSFQIKTAVNQQTNMVEEFEAIAKGTRYLLQKEKPSFDEDFILVSIGTGTSIFHVSSDATTRVAGSGIGGGTLLGMGSIITGRKDFHQIIELAKKGSNHNSDLLVKDIYAPHEPPIPGALTAANFGKAHVNKTARVEDYVASLIQMIGETIITLAVQCVQANQMKKVVFVGSTLNGNEPLKSVLSGFQDYYSYDPIFLDKGSHAGAIGTLL